MSHYVKHVFLCANQKAAGKKCCANAEAGDVFDHMKLKLLERDIHGPGKIRVSKSGCLGRCSAGPCIVVYPEGIWYHYDTLADVDEIIEHHLLEGKIVEHLLIEPQ